MLGRGLMFVGVLAMTPTLVACGADKNDAIWAADVGYGQTVVTPPDTKISGDEREYHINVTNHLAKAGAVTFTMTNYGTMTHEMLIVRTEFAPGRIPIGADHRFNEDDPTSKVVGEISEYDAGSTQTKTFDLAPGKYQLVCNIPDHYSQGMSISFEVVA